MSIYDSTPAARAHYQDLQRRQNVSADRDRAERKAPTDDEIRDYIERQVKSVEQEAAENRNEEVAAAWVTAHPEYKASDRSSALMQEFLTARGLPMTQANLTAAFSYLAERNLVETNDAAVQQAIRETAQAAELQRRADRQAKNLRTYSDEELYSLPLSDLEELARRQA